jgi:hypothetical protein
MAAVHDYLAEAMERIGGQVSPKYGVLMAISTGHGAGEEPDAVDVPVALACWRSRELRLAHTFRECAGAASAKIEEL